MQKSVCLAFGATAALTLTMMAPAVAAPRVKVKTSYYSISGSTGMELFRDMNRKGPRHAFMKKAMAQTQYRSTPSGKVTWQNGVCSVKNGSYTLDLTYVYPKPDRKLSGRLAVNWNRFMADTYRHEKVHGQIAIEMVAKLDATLRSFRMKDKDNCARAMTTLAGRINGIYDIYKKKQMAFDVAEHRKGGKVEKSVLVLVKE